MERLFPSEKDTGKPGIIPGLTIPVSGVGLNTNGLTLPVGEEATLHAIVEPADATNTNVTWGSSDDTVATVINGLVSALAEGSATITVTTVDGGFQASCEVTVEPFDPNAVYVTGVTLNQTKLDMIAGETETLIATVEPENASNKNVNWSTSNSAVATFTATEDTAVVTAVGGGTATITVTTNNGKTADCTVTVTVPTYTVTFFNDDEKVDSQTVDKGGMAEEPELPPKEFAIIAGLYLGSPEDARYYKFDGWFDEYNDPYDFDTRVTGDITLTAKWTEPRITEVEENNVAAAVTYVNAHPATYTLLLDKDVEAGFQWLKEANVNLTIMGMESERTIQLEDTANAALFELNNASASLTLGNNITLKGITNTHSLVQVFAGTLTMKTGSKITGHEYVGGGGGGGVYVGGGTFTMNGGEISGNYFSLNDLYENGNGGGVYVSGGTFTMTGGTISGNNVFHSLGYGSGGGVFVNGGTFTMQSGEISGNAVFELSYGSGVYVNDGIFTMVGGTISGNGDRSGVAVSKGRFNMDGGEISHNPTTGVYVDNGTFTMTGGKISDNTGSGVCMEGGAGTFTMIDGTIFSNTSYDGGGVFVGDSETFNMKGGKIFGNNASNGGGVYVYYGTFTMESGEISGNNAFDDSGYANGGGVYVYYGTFTMEGGAISDNIVNDNGGGVFMASIWDYDNAVYLGGTFIMNGGAISDNTAGIGGGGVYVSCGTFTMGSGGAISGNNALGGSGGGVYMNDGTFDMEGGAITDNNALGGSGGGVFVGRGIFTMSSGEISGNDAGGSGGGVYVDRATFTMSSGEISGNNALGGSGGGVYVGRFGAFQIVNGTIYGSNETNSLKNTAANKGAALYKDSAGTAHYGTFSGDELNGTDLPLTPDNSNGYTNDTIRVENGVLIQ
jgi:hypothetical protein